ERVTGRDVRAERVHVIPNWSDDEEIVPVAHANNPLRSQWSLVDKFVVGYSGNLGRAHEFETILAASTRLRGHDRIAFVCIGGGHHFDEFARRVREHGVKHMFRFVPYQDRKLLKFSLGVPDTHWISLKPELEGLIVPSKFYGIAAAGRAVISISARDGEIARLVEQHDCGLVVS